MATTEFKLLVAFETHAVKDIRKILDAGFDVRSPIKGKSLVNSLTEMYSRSDSLPDCLRLLLLDAGTRPDVRLEGITWGRGFEWETTCFDVTPISYAQLGLLPQVHRRELDIYANIRRLLQAAGRRVPALDNVPNRYLEGS